MDLLEIWYSFGLKKKVFVYQKLSNIGLENGAGSLNSEMRKLKKIRLFRPPG